jgi:hypothetical protein
MAKGRDTKRHTLTLLIASLCGRLLVIIFLINPDLALLVEWNSDLSERLETSFEFFEIGGGPGFFDGALQHEGVGRTLAKTQQLNEEDGVVICGSARGEILVKICAEAVFSLNCSVSLKKS